MRPDAEPSWTQSQRFADKAARIDPADLPEALIHHSYYAIYHGASAALLAAYGSAPTKHGRVGDALVRLAIEREGEVFAQRLRVAVSEAYHMRVRADYQADTPLERIRADAEEIAAHRRLVLDFCQRVLMALD